MTTPSAAEHAVHDLNVWLRDLGQVDDAFSDPEHGYKALRAVLQTVRDRLVVDEAADLGAQLPTLVRGVYYNAWRPAATPELFHDEASFLRRVHDRLSDDGLDPKRASTAVFELLNRKISAGEINDVRSELPKPVSRMWPID